MNESLDPFQTQLLMQLRREVIESPRSDPQAGRSTAPRASRRFTARRVSLAAAAAGAAASVALSLGVVSIGGAGTTPAFAVTTAHNGDVVVTITGPADAQDLEAALRTHGLDVDVIYDDKDFLMTPEDERTALGGSYGGQETKHGWDTTKAAPGISWTRTHDNTVSVMRVHGSFADERYPDQHLTMLLSNRDGITLVIPWQCSDKDLPAYAEPLRAKVCHLPGA